MQEAHDKGVLYLDSSDIGAMYECQPHQAIKIRGMEARLSAIKQEDQIGPRFVNLRLSEAAAQTDTEFQNRNREGTRERIKKGVNHEPLA
jgi:hypothetical protein